MNGDWIKIHRQIDSWEWRDDPNTFFGIPSYSYERSFSGSQFIADNLSSAALPELAQARSRRFADSLGKRSEQPFKSWKKTSEITSETTSIGLCITCCNYESYQSDEVGSNQQTNQVATNEQPTSNQPATNQQPQQKKGNKGKNGKSKARANSLDEVIEFCESIGLPKSDGEACWHKWEGNGWVNGKNKINCWKSTIRSWKAANYLPSQKNYSQFSPNPKPRNSYDNPEGLKTFEL